MQHVPMIKLEIQKCDQTLFMTTYTCVYTLCGFMQMYSTAQV